MRKMKDSGIAWIGEIPEGWKVYELRRIGLFSASGINKKIVEGEPLVRIINYTDVYGKKNYILCAKDYMTVSAPIEKIKEHQVEIGDVIFTPSSETVEDIGVSAVVMEELENTAYSYHVLRFRFFIDVCNAYKKYMFNNAYIQNYYSSRAVGSIRKTLSRDDFKGTKVCLPDFCEQQKIADFLDKKCVEIDKLIELQDSMIDKLKEYKQSVITQAVTKGLDPDVPMKESGIEWIGKISQRFVLRRLKEIVRILDEYRKPITSDLRNQNAEILYDYYGASGVIDKIDGYTIDDHVMLIGEDGANLRMRNLPLMYEVKGKAWINNHAHILKPKKDTDFYFLFYCLESMDINPYITGSAQPKLSQENLKNILLPIPPFKEQQQIADYLDKKCAEIDDLIKLKEQKIEKLKEYKKSLIYEYVTGKKEVV